MVDIKGIIIMKMLGSITLNLKDGCNENSYSPIPMITIYLTSNVKLMTQ